ncbi:glycosyltransferase [Paractinoplanes lichenicola]|uniref:Glycosyl transferase n=1 Tax=Paractinoplanes lichenicola TaxID=2802976 RepID=A0ABS1W5I6_9ACTN|nr:glycosyltransferase [Actinoplanes lichenicola]MBL7262006.1 glycosyl transferase [Actinoplanes lichenicola]
MTATVHDVAILADFRFAGAGVAAEVLAQHEAALSTLLVHVPRDARPLPFAPRVRDLLRDGAATLAREDQPAAVRLLVARGPDLLARARTRVRAEHTVVVVEQAPAPGDLPEDVDWAPVDDRVRDAMPLLCRLTVQNWHEIVDAAASWQEFPERFRALERTSGHQSHLRRLAGFGIRPRISAPALPREPGPVPPAPTRRVLMVGAPTRLTAIARRLPAALAPVIATEYASPGGGFLTEHIPSREALGATEAAWNRMLRDRLAHLVDLHRPEIVAVDDLPHEGIVEAVRAHPHVLWVWVRRAMWPRGTGQEWITEGKVFDHVLEPGEFAALADDGPTVAERAGAHRVEPITLLDAGELLDPAAARADLGLDDRPAALVRLSDTRVVERLEGHGFQVVVREQGVSRYLRAFDLVVSSAGYDAYHEQLRFGIPTVLVPRRDDPLDDQLGRARYADAAGVALAVEDPDSEELERALDTAARPDKRAVLRRRCEELTFSNGASAAATWLGGLAARHERIGG